MNRPTSSGQFIVQEAQWPTDIKDILQLFGEYKAEIGGDLCFHGFELERNGLPGEYAPPHGLLLIAKDSERAVAGCVALRRLDEGICEMKRLFVRSAFRGQGLGRTLAHAIIEAAKRSGYRRMRLDTLESMTTARSLYESLGFHVIPAYYCCPVSNVVYYELDL